jgi:hypothetical protein
MKTILHLVLILFLTSSCRKKATIDLPEAEVKLVVTCFITPGDSVISAVVRLSKPKFGAPESSSVFQDDVKNATIILSDGSSQVTLPFDNDLLFYRISASQFPVVAGRTYYLTVTTPDGKRTSGSTIVPQDTLEIQTMNLPVRNQDSTSFEHDINIVVKDIPDKVNYVQFYFTNRIVTKARSNPNFPNFPGMISWSYFDNDEKAAKSSFYHSSVNGHYSSDTIVTAALDISILNCSKEFYLYNKSVNEGGFTNPFADPVMIYTNMDDGFGCFGAYRAVNRTYVIR